MLNKSAQLNRFLQQGYLNSCNNNQTGTYTINLGPQHPASHGVLRLVLQMRGEVIEKVDANIGFLHRGSERLMELNFFMQNTLFLERLDYTSVLTQSHAYCLCIESLYNGSVTFTTKLIRILFDELARILNHTLAISSHSLDAGSMAPLFWVFEEREKIMEIFEFVSGARMHTAFYLPLKELDFILSYDFFNKMFFFLKNCYKAFVEMFISLFNHRMWKIRLVNVGILSYQDALIFGTSGPMLRSTGLCMDLRISKLRTYSNYSLLTLTSYIGTFGDCFDRFLIRSHELFESLLLIYQVLGYLININIRLNTVLTTKIESVIHHFTKQIADLAIDTNFNYIGVEAGKGEFGVGIFTNNTNKPWRVHLRSPAFNHLQTIGRMTQGHLLGDLITIVGSLDLVFGEVDR